MFENDKYINEEYARKYLSSSVEKILNYSAILNQDRYVSFTSIKNETLKLKTIDVDGDSIFNQHYNELTYEDGIILVFYFLDLFSLTEKI